MLTELQSNYDKLLHRFAAAENALDKVEAISSTPHSSTSYSTLSQVRFGAKPPPGHGEREEVFSMAESVAGKIAAMETEERRQGEDFRAWLGQLEDRDRDNSLAEDRQEVKGGIFGKSSFNLNIAPHWVKEGIEGEICSNSNNVQMALTHFFCDLLF